MAAIPKEVLDQINADIERLERERLIREHGVEKAEEILLNRELGELTYELDAEEPWA